MRQGKQEAPTGGRRRGRSAGAQRILVGVRLEERLVKVMKGLAELRDETLGELIEQVMMNAMDGSNAFADRGGRISSDMRQRIAGLKQVYGVDYSLDELHAPRR